MPHRHTPEPIMINAVASIDWASLDIWVCDEGCNLKFSSPEEAIEHFAAAHPEGHVADIGKVPCKFNCGWRGPLGHHWVHYVRNHMKRQKKEK